MMCISNVEELLAILEANFAQTEQQYVSVNTWRFDYHS